ncbi:heme utilization protein HuvX [Ferrimonas balearica DSM 9799]|uniref:Heme utilization protein HuvX n=1 Tax=Ferrimonas balearica (strain DSM 9799 / CCM 4581 / KCTC 23876 / PAT) TaxID=550540 RepID=E1SL64_FERBD|nr:heme utilization cystosolic carrier protein HutX [Ferrimonas balearica]ADN75442.1 heme utilization protein HuvX [Ferrimonas balearica DSM 9799]
MIELQQAVAKALDASPGATTSQLALDLGVSEASVVAALPDNMSVPLDIDLLDELLAELPEWGPMTTIVFAGGSVFEFKCPFPKGKSAYGYYNLMGKHGFEGHLKLDNVGSIYLVSRAHRGAESHSFQFFTHRGELVFKLFLGRDKARKLLPEQLQRFAQYRSKAQPEKVES